MQLYVFKSTITIIIIIIIIVVVVILDVSANLYSTLLNLLTFLAKMERISNISDDIKKVYIRKYT